MSYFDRMDEKGRETSDMKHGEPRRGSLLELRGKADPGADPVARHRRARALWESDGEMSDEGQQGTSMKAEREDVASPGLFGRLLRRARPVGQSPDDAVSADAALTGDHARAYEEDEQAALVKPETVDTRRAAAAIAGGPTVGSLFGGIARNRSLLLAATAIGALAAAAFHFASPAKYVATAEILVEPRVLSGEQGASFAVPESTLAVVENQARILRSTSVLDVAVDRLNLANDPEFNGRASGLGAILGGVELPARAAAVRKLGESLDVKRSPGTFVVTVGAAANDAEKSALLANTVTDIFIESHGRTGFAAAPSSGEELRAALEQAERAVETFKTDNGIVDAQGRLISDDEIVRLNEQLSAARAKTVELNAAAESARDANVDAIVGGSLPEQLNSAVMTELRAQYSALKQTADRLSVKLGPRHPERLAVQAQLDGARAELDAERRRIGESLQVQLKRAVQQEQDLAARLARMKARQGDLGGEMIRLRELERDAEDKRLAYDAFLSRMRDGASRTIAGGDRVSVISRASAPAAAAGPGLSASLLLGMLFGLLGGVGIAGIREAFGRRAAGSGEDRAPALTDARQSHVSGSTPEAGFGAAPGEAEEEEFERRPRELWPLPFLAEEPRVFEGDNDGWPIPELDEDRLEDFRAALHDDTWVRDLDDDTLEEIRSSLREIREAIEDLAESRDRVRRYGT